MKKLFIKYNPYKLETEITVDEQILVQNSKLGEKITPGSRLQDWVEELPNCLIEEYSDNQFDITFHGTLLDYEDLKEVFESYYKRGELNAQFHYIQAKESSDKEKLIDDVFKEIQEGPFDELRDAEILNAFQHAKSNEFEVCVVATMSSGKSTLINALLGTKLMPSKQEACTAIITRIKDNDKPASWKAKVQGKDSRLLETHEELTYEKMKELNDNEKVSVIEVNGDIPFVGCDSTSLILIDTPGPNNSRDPEHKKVQSEFLGKSCKSLVLYIMDGTFGTDDDNQLLDRVANSMSVEGKQSKDRFIFVVNKMDERKKEDGDTGDTLNRIRHYLENHQIMNPNLFPVSALQALNIRLIENNTELDEDTIDETEIKVRKLNRNKFLHLESYATLPSSLREDINKQLNEAGNDDNVNAQALIHTGIVSLESAIRQYVNKYAKTAKIRNIVDTFIHKLDEVGCFEETKSELAQNRDQKEKVMAQINAILQKVDDVKSAQNFKNAVNTAVTQINEHSLDVSEHILSKFQSLITEKIDEFRGKEVYINEVSKEVKKLEQFAQNLEPEFRIELDELIRENLIKTSTALLEEYRKKLTYLIEEMDSNVFSGIKIDPLKLMGGSVISANDFSVNKFIQTKNVEDGKEWIENTDKKWYKPWTWLEEDGYYRTKFKAVSYVRGEEIAHEYFADIQVDLFQNAQSAYAQALEQSNQIAKLFNNEFARLDDVLKQKLTELERFANEKEQVEELIDECKSKLNWLEDIKAKVESILEI